MNTLLTQIAALAKPRHPWSDARDLITNGYIEAVDARGFTVLTSTGTERLDVPKGMTVEAYTNLAPYCSEEIEKGILARGVLENLLAVDWQTWNRFESVFFREKKESIEEWLPRAVELHGFKPVLAGIKEAIAQLPPLPPQTPALREVPNGFLLRYGHNEWTFSNHATIIKPILIALQRNKWEPVKSVDYSDGVLKDMQIKFAVNQLNHKTTKVISWHACTTTYPLGTPIPNGLDKKRGPTRKYGETKITGVWWKSLL